MKTFMKANFSRKLLGVLGFVKRKVKKYTERREIVGDRER
jgi:hypothetical protein